MRMTRPALILLITLATLAGCASNTTRQRQLAPDPLGATRFALTPGTTAGVDPSLAITSLDIRQQALHAERDRVAALARARELAQLGYGSGAFSYLDLLDAERNWYPAQLEQVNAYRDQLFGQIATFKAPGGGYAADGAPQSVRP